MLRIYYQGTGEMGCLWFLLGLVSSLHTTWHATQQSALTWGESPQPNCKFQPCQRWHTSHSELIPSLVCSCVNAFVKRRSRWGACCPGSCAEPVRCCGGATGLVCEAMEWDAKRYWLPRDSQLILAAVTRGLCAICVWEAAWIWGRRRPRYYKLAGVGLCIDCQDQKGDQLLWLWQVKLKLSISAVESLLLVLQPVQEGQMEGTCLAGGQTVSQ